MSEKYTYAVARIRALEVSLFSNAVIDQLIACQSYEQCLQFLAERGWGDTDTSADGEKMLKREEEKIWQTVRELSIDKKKFDVLSDQKMFHNQKAAVKAACVKEVPGDIFYEDTEISGQEMLDIIREKDFGRLPAGMSQAAQQACDALLHAGDGQLCDIIIDRAALDAIYKAGMESEDEIIRDYARSVVAVADIKIAVRAQKTAKSIEFMKQAMAECGSISVDQLAKAALSGPEAIRDYLLGTEYAGGAEALSESMSAFERWCDNRIIQTISPQKYKAFTIGPVVAYLLARQNEIKTVRIVLSGKRSELPEGAIRERVREMYV